MLSNTSTAVLIFTRNAVEEADSKRLHRNLRKGSLVAAELIKHTHKTVRRTGLPFFTVTEQVGESFGERISHAFREIFDQGFDRVIAVGNDSPDLHARHILQAHEQLNKHQFVLGPAKDGGLYLIGIDRDAFDEEELQNLPWRQAHLFDDFRNQIACKGQAVFISATVLTDIDSHFALQYFLHHRSGHTKVLIQKLRSILSPRLISKQGKRGKLRWREIGSTALRAPPSWPRGLLPF